jgi:hypothetical protein
MMNSEDASEDDLDQPENETSAGKDSFIAENTVQGRTADA